MDNDLFIWLQNWYQSQCDDEWEHAYGIEIQTLDNPGWLIHINLVGTELENCSFAPITINRSNIDWIECLSKNRQFQGAGGALNLLEIITIFKSWIESQTDHSLT